MPSLAQVGYSGIQAGVGPGAVALTGPMAAVGALQSAAVAQVGWIGCPDCLDWLPRLVDLVVVGSCH